MKITDIKETDTGFIFELDKKYKYRFYNKRMALEQMSEIAIVGTKRIIENKKKKASKDE